MLTARRLSIYTHDRKHLTPRQRRRAVHKANRLEPAARRVALAAIAVLVAGAGCAAGGGQAPRIRLAEEEQRRVGKAKPSRFKGAA